MAEQFGNWTQKNRRDNLEKVASLIKAYGGYASILNDMKDFLSFVAFELGCSQKTAREYVETVRGASIFRQRQMSK